MKTVTIEIARVVGGGICVAASDGNRVHDAILAAIRNGDRIVLSFHSISRMTTAFLNAAVGQLYGEYSEEEIRRFLAPPIHAEPWHLSRLKLVVDRAKSFFANPKAATTAFKNVTGIENEEGD